MTSPKTVLLMMDFQHGIVERSGSQRALASAVRAADAARAANVPIFFVRVAFRPGYPEVAASNRSFSQTALHAGDTMTEHHSATQVHLALRPRDNEPIVTKRRISAFSGSDLDVLLRGAGAKHLVLAGISTSGVVLSTIRQAADMDYGLTVLEDACADPDAEIHRVLMEKVFPRQAEVMSTDAWVEKSRLA